MAELSASKPNEIGYTTTRYCSEPIVSDGSFLRRLPTIVAAPDRLRFDAIVLAADVLTSTYRALRQVAAQIQTDIDKFDARTSSFVLGCCWTIVDQLFAVRQLVLTMIPRGMSPGPDTERFL